MRKTIILLLLLSLCQLAKAGPGEWCLKETPHFYIYYPTNCAEQLTEIGALAESIHNRLTAVFPSTIWGKTQLVLADWTDESNGLTNVFPYPQITIYLSTPQDSTRFGLGQMEWLEYILTHEYAHVLQLGGADGIPAALRRVFGSIILSAPFVPPWAYEGWAVYCESNFGPGQGGRLFAPYFRAMLRHDLLEGNLKRLDQASNLVLDWPGPLLWYPYGALFFEYLSGQYGQETMVEFFRNLAEKPPAICFAAAFEDTYGLSLDAAYKNWQDQLALLVGALSPRQGTQLTEIGAHTNYPVWDKEGALYYLAGAYNQPQRLMKYSDGKHIFLSEWDDEEEFVLGADGELIFAQARWQGDNYYYDLFTSNRSKGNAVRLTRTLRARQPSLSPDGKQLAFVVNDPPRRHIYLLDLEEKQAQPLLEATDTLSFHSPAWSPDGKTLAVVTEHKGRGRQLELVDLESGVRRALTGHFWQEGSPSWDPVGRYLLFTAQAEGWVNLYAYDLEEERILLVARDAGPAQVSPDGTQIAYVASTSEGNQIYSLPFQLQGEVGLPVEMVMRQYAPLPQVATKTTGYRAWPSLRPQFWLPMVQAGALGAFTMGKDALDFYSYTCFLGLGSQGDLAYSLNFKTTFPGPELEFSSSSSGGHALGLTKYWRSIKVPNGTLALGCGWRSGEGWRLSGSYSTARLYGLNPYPSRGLTLSVAARGLEKNALLTAQATRWAPLAGAVTEGSLALARGGLQPENIWAGSLWLRWPAILWQRGSLTPPFYLVDSWQAVGLKVKSEGTQLCQSLLGELATRFTVAFVPTPLTLTLGFAHHIPDKSWEGSLNFKLDL